MTLLLTKKRLGTKSAYMMEKNSELNIRIDEKEQHIVAHQLLRICQVATAILSYNIIARVNYEFPTLSLDSIQNYWSYLNFNRLCISMVE